MTDLDFMARAIELAKKGRLKVQPNPMVGCVIVKNKKIIGEGWHHEYGKDHAEINAIKNCKKKYGVKKAFQLLAGSSVYVNLEPNPKINGRGIKLLKKAGIKTSVGLLKEECKELNRIFFTNQKKFRPYIILKSAQSLDGKIALQSGESNWITSLESRKNSHYIRSRVKGILIGRATAEQDNPSLSVRLTRNDLGLSVGETIIQPAKIILGNLKKSKKVSNIFSKNAKIIIGSSQQVKKSNNVEYLEYKKKNFLEDFLKDLLDRNISSILVEGGQKTLNPFIDNNLFDELVLYTAPIFLGKGSTDALKANAPDSIKNSMKLKMVKLERFKDDIKTTYYNESL